MTPIINADLKVPDLWYDFYARLLPGCSFVGMNWFVYRPNIDINIGSLLIAAFAGFIVGLITQPLSSMITSGVEWVAESVKPNEKRVFEVKSHFGLESRQAKILNKMHGEITFFVQLFVLNGIFILYTDYTDNIKYNSILEILFESWFLISILITSYRRFQRSNKYYKHRPKE